MRQREFLTHGAEMRRAQRRIHWAYLRSATSERVYDWLKDEWTLPTRDEWRGAWEKDYARISDREPLERLLLRRRDGLIDAAIAQFGYSPKALATVFARGDRAIRVAVLVNPQFGLSWECFRRLVVEVVSRRHPCELQALASNPYLPDETFEAMLQRRSEFAMLSDRAYALMLRALGHNPRLALDRSESDGRIDFWADARFHSVAAAAWELTRTLPASEEWAAVLVELLQHAAPWGLPDVHQLLDRWTLEPTGDVVQWSADLRTLLADLLPPDESLLHSKDLGVRQSFYRRFDPRRFPNWPDFAAIDGEDFAIAAISLGGGNGNIWRDPHERARLQGVARECDRAGRDDFWIENLFRRRVFELRRAHPEWFANDALDEDEDDDDGFDV